MGGTHAGRQATVLGDPRNRSLEDLASELQRTLWLVDTTWSVTSADQPAGRSSVVAVLGPVASENERLGELVREHDGPAVAIVSAAGSVRWDRRRQDFDPVDSPALPTPLLGAFEDPPVLVSLPLAARSVELNVDEPAQRAAIDHLASHLSGVEVERFAELRSGRRRRLAAILVSAALLTVGVAGFALGRAQSGNVVLSPSSGQETDQTAAASSSTTTASATSAPPAVETDVAGLTAELRGEVERANEALGRANDEAIEADAARVEAERNAEEADLERLAAQEARDDAVASADVAERARVTATGERAAFESITLSDTRPDRAALIALEATRRTDSPTASHALLSILQAEPLLVGYRGLSAAPPRGVEVLDDKRLAVLLDDGTIETRDRTDGSVQSSWQSSSRATVIVVPTPGTLVTGHIDGAIRLWSADGDLLDEQIGAHSGSVQEIEYGRSGELLVSLAADSTAPTPGEFTEVIAWDIADGLLVEQAREAEICGRATTLAVREADGLVFVPSGRCNNTPGPTLIRVYEAESLTIDDIFLSPVQFQPGPVSSRISAASAFADLLFYGTNEGDIYLLDVSDGSSVLLDQQDGLVSEIGYSRRFDVLVTTGFDGLLRIIRTGTQELRAHDSSVLDFTIDGSRIFTAAEDGTVAEWNIAEQRSLQSAVPSARAALTEPAAPTSGGWFIVGDRSGVLTRRSTPDGEQLSSVEVSVGLSTVGLSPAGDVIAAGGVDGSVVFVGSSLEDEPEVHHAAHAGPTLVPGAEGVHVTAIAFNAAGTIAVSTADDGTVLRWTQSSSRWTSEVAIRANSEVWDVAFSPVDDIFVIASRSGVHVIDGVSLQQTTTLRPVEREMFGVAFNQRGSELAMTGISGVVHRYDTANWQPVGEPLSPPGASQSDIFLYSVAYSPDGTRLVATSIFGTFLWDLASGVAIGSGFAHPASYVHETAEPTSGRIGVSGAALTDDAIIFTRSGLSAEIIPTKLEVWRAAACALANRNLTPAEWESAFPDDPYDPSCDP